MAHMQAQAYLGSLVQQSKVGRNSVCLRNDNNGIVLAELG